MSIILKASEIPYIETLNGNVLIHRVTKSGYTPIIVAADFAATSDELNFCLFSNPHKQGFSLNFDWVTGLREFEAESLLQYRQQMSRAGHPPFDSQREIRTLREAPLKDGTAVFFKNGWCVTFPVPVDIIENERDRLAESGNYPASPRLRKLDLH